MLSLSSKDPSTLAMVGRALSTELRVRILNEISKENINVVELAKRLEYPVSTIASNLNILEEAGLITSEYLPAKNGSMKVCAVVYHDVHINLVENRQNDNQVTKHVVDMPIGNYHNCEVQASCGLYGHAGYIGHADSVQSFYYPERTMADIIWFRRGWIEYRIPLLTMSKPIKAIDIELELCSEFPGSNNTWKSDITMWINDVEVGTWTSPGDFGDRKGRLTPDEWTRGNTQYGLLKTWYVGDKALGMDEFITNDTDVQELNLDDHPYMAIKIGVKDDAENQGGINLFGKRFGDYEQDIRVSFYY